MTFFPRFSGSRSRLLAHARAYSLGLGTYLLLTFGTMGASCNGDECFHDWQCGDSEICVPYDGDNTCFYSPVCNSDDDCAGEECFPRLGRQVNSGNRDPFTTDDPVKKTCGGDSGPPEPVDSVGCGFSSDDDSSVGGEDSVGGFDSSGGFGGDGLGGFGLGGGGLGGGGGFGGAGGLGGAGGDAGGASAGGAASGGAGGSGGGA